MAPTLGGILKRDNYAYCDAYGNCYGDDTWSSWGRWVALAGIILAFVILAFLLSCYNNRRRRRRGMAPMAGTGWMGANNWNNQYNNGNPNGGYYANQPYHGGAAPAYTPQVENQVTGTSYPSGEGYYGAHNNYELQQPQAAYQPQRGGDNVYDAPPGPPPKKGDHVIR